MGKISQVSAKYIIHAGLQIEGIVDKPDIIGAVFGQTEGLLGSDLELRELQRNGRIGRIEVNTAVQAGKTKGTILIPSSLDKAETCIVGAAMEVIERIGPCNAHIVIEKIEDVRISKRTHVVDRAKELLRTLVDSVMPDSQEISDEVAYSVRQMEISTYGREKLPAGPGIEDSDEVIVVEGRADVLNLLKYGFKNVISMNGTSVPQTIIDLSKEKTVTVFVDGDRGGDLIVRELGGVAEIDFVTKAPDGKEVEEITKKEINKALRSRIAFEQAKHELKNGNGTRTERTPTRAAARPTPTRTTTTRTPSRAPARATSTRTATRAPARSNGRKPSLNDQEQQAFKGKLDELVGTRGAFLLDEKLEVLGKVPTTELASTIASLQTGIYAVLFDGEIDKDLALASEKAKVKFLIGMDNKLRGNEARVAMLTSADL